MKTLTLEDIKDKSIDDIVKLYQEGYRLYKSVISGTGTIGFDVRTYDGPISQAIIYIDGKYKGITNGDGHFTLDLPATNIGTSHEYIIFRDGFNGTFGKFILLPNGASTLHIILTDLTVGKGSALFNVYCVIDPCEGAHIIVNGIDIGMTSSDGSFLAEGLNTGIEVPYTIRKQGFKDVNGSLIVVDRFTNIIPFVYLTNTSSNEGIIIFTVIDNQGNPIKDVQIRLDNILLGSTDSNGEFASNIIHTGIHSYLAYKDGFITSSGQIELFTFIRPLPIIMAKS